ncbi:MAG: OB-fold domain-containing protein [Candidatus Tectomicrobia bacterium]|uniref:OB-fold domain-containing protein n=1 Tax=Tectimicrobiota bacterium TaxID=2528274 RepID=A0A932CNL1_UNCTE|nr:OB-fold domain-containing protein [Candidatus Tectomicrobia bacterium]
MAGIIAAGAYVPLYRIGKETSGWGASAEKAVANFDEDSVTMGVAAALDCLKGVDRSSVDALFFATTTSPYQEKQVATIAATALDLRPDVFTTDCTNSLRAGTSALRMALDGIKSGSIQRALVIAADCRMGPPKGSFDRTSGDGAAALLLGKAEIAASVEASHALSREIVDVWRVEGEPFVRSWEDRFVITQGYQKIIQEAVSDLLKRCNLTPKEIAKAILYGPDAGSHTAVARALGFDVKTQVQDPLFSSVGSAGAAHALMQLVAALEQARPGDRMLLANYGDGSDAYILQATDQVGQAVAGRMGMKGHVATKKMLKSYDTYLRWRQFMPSEAARRPPMVGPSASALLREQSKNLKLYGVTCKQCGTTQYPPQRVCTRCHAKDNFESVRLSDRKATLFTYAMDYIAGSVDPPLVVSVINFEGGGRMLCAMTDREVSELQVDMPVQMSFRKLFQAGGIHNYYWKCMPVRG